MVSTRWRLRVRHRRWRGVRARPRSVAGNGLYLRVDRPGLPAGCNGSSFAASPCALGLGSFSLVSLAEAREQALANRRIARAGSDPLAERRRAHGIPTFEEAAGQVLALHQTAWKNSCRTAQLWQATMRDYAYPHLGGKAVDQVTTAEVMAVLLPIWSRKHETAWQTGTTFLRPATGIEFELPVAATAQHRSLGRLGMVRCVPIGAEGTPAHRQGHEVGHRPRLPERQPGRRSHHGGGAETSRSGAAHASASARGGFRRDCRRPRLAGMGGDADWPSSFWC